MKFPFFVQDKIPPPDIGKIKLARQYTYLLEKLSDIRANYDFVTDDDEIDALIYEENAVLSKLAALYKQARAEGTALEIFEQKY